MFGNSFRLVGILDDGVEHAAAVSGLKRAGSRRRRGQRWGVEFGQDVAAKSVPHSHGFSDLLRGVTNVSACVCVRVRVWDWPWRPGTCACL